MSSSPLRVGSPAFADGSIPPIEGARLLSYGPILRLLVVYEEPTPEEIAAVEQAAVELGVYHDDGLAAVAIRIGEPGSPGLIETMAPLVYLAGTVHTDGDGGDGGALPSTYPAEVALCEAERTVVLAIRRFDVPADLICVARQAALAQAARFESLADANRAQECGLRYHTARDLLNAAAASAWIPAGRQRTRQ